MGVARDRLLEAKLQGLVRAVATDVGLPEDYVLELRKAPGGTGGLVVLGESAHDSPAGFVVVDDGDEATQMQRRRHTGESSQIRALGPALLWAMSAGAAQLHVFVDHDDADSARHLARRASFFDLAISVWSVRAPLGGDLSVAKADPAPLGSPPPLSEAVESFRDVILASGARAVDDFGRLVAEVRGLEVARVVEFDDGGAPELQVGVGQADRELHRLVHTNLETSEALQRAVDMVEEVRVPGAVRHPLQRLAKERWYRDYLLDRPDLVGAIALEPLAPLRDRATLLGTQPAAASGVNSDGNHVVVVASVGVDPDLLPEAADYQHRVDPQASLVVVVPPQDRLRPIDELLSIMSRTEFLSVPPPWENQGK